MTEHAAPGAMHVDERRLHPMSWLFVLLQQLRQFIVPLVALLLFGRGDRNELWPLIGVAGLVVVSVWRYFTYRYSVQDDRLLVRSGLLERSARTIPFARIHNVDVRQSVLHRVFGVAEVRLESAGGRKPEAQMRVLALDDALALEALVRQRGQAPVASAAAGAGEGDVAVPPPLPLPRTRLLHLPPGEVVRLGLVSNRGLVVAAAGVAGLMQFGPRDMAGDAMRRAASGLAEQALGYGGAHGYGTLDYALAGLVLIAVLAALLRLLSVALALAQYANFELTEQGRRLTIERGLLARWRSSLSKRRIQAWTLHEGVLHRLLRRRSLQVDIATGADPSDNQRQAAPELAPIATPQACDGLIEHLLPRAHWRTLDWQPLPSNAWWRLALPSVAATLLVALILAARFGTPGLLALAWLPVALWIARKRLAHAGYAVGDEIIAARDGWWSRTWRFAEVDTLQAMRLERSPLDRRFGTTTLLLDTAGGRMGTPPLRIRFMPAGAAQALQARLADALARRALRW